MKTTHFNGGIEQAILEMVNEDNLLSPADKERLEYLQSLPQNRVEDSQSKQGVSTRLNLIIEDNGI